MLTTDQNQRIQTRNFSLLKPAYNQEVYYNILILHNSSILQLAY